MRFLLFVLFLFCFALAGFADVQKDSLILKKDSFQSSNIKKRFLPDSATLVRKAFLRDSLTYQYLKPDPNRPNPFIEDLLRKVIITDPYLLTPAKSVKIKKSNFGTGEYIGKMPIWFFLVIILLLVFFGIIKIAFKKQIDLIFKAFYDNRTLHQINKEENIFMSWQFLFLYLIFSFTIGLFTCLILYKTKASSSATDFNTFLIVSFFVFIFFGLKILMVRFLGIVFKVQKLVREYTNIIYLTYFNLLFVLLPITFCLSLINLENQYTLFWLITALLLIIIAFQFIRITINILLNYRLSKFYLILYLCALEICPILIFARTINISL
jgi:hypothetical protein